MKKSIYSNKSAKLQDSLIKARVDAGMTQQDLADKLEKPQSFVAKYEGGERRLDIIELTSICEVLGVKSEKIIKSLD